MIPAKYAEELKNAPDSKADFTGSFVEVCFLNQEKNPRGDMRHLIIPCTHQMFEGEYTTIGKRWHLHPLVIRASLNGQLGMPWDPDTPLQAQLMKISRHHSLQRSRRNPPGLHLRIPRL